MLGDQSELDIAALLGKPSLDAGDIVFFKSIKRWSTDANTLTLVSDGDSTFAVGGDMNGSLDSEFHEGMDNDYMFAGFC